jgi:hypothetical protein
MNRGQRQSVRTFVGTPVYMAPEGMECTSFVTFVHICKDHLIKDEHEDIAQKPSNIICMCTRLGNSNGSLIL